MNRENTKKLVERFPKMFGGIHKPMTKTAMCWGFEHGDGWFSLIWDLCMSIEGLFPPKNFEVTQVKEKFGTLRFYTLGGTKKIEDKIDEAEINSAKICEWCGKKGKLRGRGWLLTLCDSCNGWYEMGYRWGWS